MPEIATSALKNASLLVDRELTEREDRRLTTRLRQAKLRQAACLEDLDYRQPRVGQSPDDDLSDVPVDSRPAQRTDHGANGHWQNLDRLRSGPTGLP